MYCIEYDNADPQDYFKRELALRGSELLVDEEGGSSSSVPGFIYSVYHVTLIHPIEPSK